MARKNFFFKVSEPKSFWEQGIEQLPLAESNYCALKRNHIDTIGEVANNWDKLTKLRGIGLNKAMHIKASFFAYLCDVPSKEAQTHIVDIW